MNVFLFHRDFRLQDNLALNELSRHGHVTCIFIFTPYQIKNNPFFSPRGFQFMCESLYELKKELQAKVDRMKYEMEFQEKEFEKKLRTMR